MIAMRVIILTAEVLAKPRAVMPGAMWPSCMAAKRMPNTDKVTLPPAIAMGSGKGDALIVRQERGWQQKGLQGMCMVDVQAKPRAVMLGAI